MKVYQSHEIKNIALLGSKGSGKTTPRRSYALRVWCNKTSRNRRREKTPSRTIFLWKKSMDIPSFPQFFMPNF